MKFRVTRDILEDMKKYVKTFNPNDYYVCLGGTDLDVLTFLRDYYSKNLPVDVTAWIKVNEGDDKVFYQEVEKQVWFVRDILCRDIIFVDYLYGCYEDPMVISTYNVESNVLPVYQFRINYCEADVIIKGDFNSWIVSINSNKSIDCSFPDLFDEEKVVNPDSCIGIPKENIYGSFKNNNKQFTIEFDGAYTLILFFKFLRFNFINDVK